MTRNIPSPWSTCCHCVRGKGTGDRRVIWAAVQLYLSGSCEWLTPPQGRPLQSVSQADMKLCVERIQRAWLWLACLLGQPDTFCKERAEAEHCAYEHRQLLFLSKCWKNNLVSASSKIKTENWWKVSLPCISSKNVEFAGISTCRGIFSFLRLRFLRSPVSALWLSRYPLVSLDACKSLKIWLVGTSASHKTAFPELSRRSDVKALKSLWVEGGI